MSGKAGQSHISLTHNVLCRTVKTCRICSMALRLRVLIVFMEFMSDIRISATSLQSMPITIIKMTILSKSEYSSLSTSLINGIVSTNLYEVIVMYFIRPALICRLIFGGTTFRQGTGNAGVLICILRHHGTEHNPEFYQVCPCTIHSRLSMIRWLMF